MAPFQPGTVRKPRRAVDDAVQRLRSPREPEVLVGPGRLELPTLRLSGVRSNHLSYGPRAARQPGVINTQARDRVTNPATRMAEASMTKVERETETAAFLPFLLCATALLLERIAMRSLNSLVRDGLEKHP